MGGPASVNIPSSVAPGQTVDVAVGLLAPAQPGSYRGDWMLRNASGTSFGAGPNGATPIWVKINVMGLPDLTVLITSEPACTYNQQSDQCVINVEFVITNPSNVDVTNAFQIVIEGTASKGQSGTATPDGDFPSKTITVYGLVAGASQNFNESLSRSGRCYICTAIVTVDPSNYIIESNETNNESEKTWWDAKGKKVDEAFRN